MGAKYRYDANAQVRALYGLKDLGWQSCFKLVSPNDIVAAYQKFLEGKSR